MSSVSPRDGPMISARFSSLNQPSTSSRIASRFRRCVLSSLVRWMISQTASMSTLVSTQSSWSSGMAMPGMAAASM